MRHRAFHDSNGLDGWKETTAAGAAERKEKRLKESGVPAAAGNSDLDIHYGWPPLIVAKARPNRGRISMARMPQCIALRSSSVSCVAPSACRAPRSLLDRVPALPPGLADAADGRRVGGIEPALFAGGGARDVRRQSHHIRGRGSTPTRRIQDAAQSEIPLLRAASHRAGRRPDPVTRRANVDALSPCGFCSADSCRNSFPRSAYRTARPSCRRRGFPWSS